MGFLWFLLGAAFGGILAFVLAVRQGRGRVEEMRAHWERKLRHATEEVRQADAAHEETKARLRQAEERLQRLEAERAHEDMELADIERLRDQARGQPLAATSAESPAEAETGAVAAAPAASGPETRTRRWRDIQAKLAQLPAGSSARRQLWAELEEWRTGGAQDG